MTTRIIRVYYGLSPERMQRHSSRSISNSGIKCVEVSTKTFGLKGEVTVENHRETKNYKSREINWKAACAFRLLVIPVGVLKQQSSERRCGSIHASRVDNVGAGVDGWAGGYDWHSSYMNDSFLSRPFLLRKKGYLE